MDTNDKNQKCSLENSNIINNMRKIIDIEKQCMSEEEKVLRKRLWWLKYAKKTWICEIFHIAILIGIKTKHLNAKKEYRTIFQHDDTSTLQTFKLYSATQCDGDVCLITRVVVQLSSR